MPALPGVAQALRLDETDSTQTVARFLAEQGAADRTLVVARRQTGGRGRLKRRWVSEEGGLYATLVLRPRLAPSRLAEVSLLAGEAFACALAKHAGVETAVKPPNDVYAACADGRARKLCGILCEATGGESRVEWLLLGFGVNVNNAPPLKTSASLRALTGRDWDLDAVLAACLRELWKRYEAL